MRKVLVYLSFLTILPMSALAADSASDYVIGDGDTLEVSVWGEPKLSAIMIVRPDGKITLPAVGDIMASGFMPEELSAKLTRKFRKLIKKPIVTVTVTQVTNNKVYIFGGGASSGEHNLPGRMTLLKFLCRVGNLEDADFERSYIVRKGKRMRVDFYDLFVKGHLAKDIMLRADDIIYIHDNKLNKIYVMGAVNVPRQISYWKGIRVTDAILEAGGFTKFAKENKVLVMRNGFEKIRVKVKDIMKGDLSQNIDLTPGDFVIVKEGIF
jgi:polysaccharide export outer membrane protein